MLKDNIKLYSDNEIINRTIEKQLNKGLTIDEAYELTKNTIINMYSEEELIEANKTLDKLYKGLSNSLNEDYKDFNGIAIDTRFIDYDKLCNIVNNIGYNAKSLCYMRVSDDLRMLHKKEMLTRHLLKSFDAKKAVEYEDSYKLKGDSLEEYKNKVISDIIEYIDDNQQYTSKETIINPFAEKEEVKYNNIKATKIEKNLFPVVPKDIKDDNIIKDYKEHFPRLDTLLDFLLASRFGADRKQCYMWLKAESNWGKSFLFEGILSYLKLTTVTKEKTIKSAINGQAVGLDVSSFTHSWVLFIDEFKSAVSEIKDITHKITFSQKFKMEETVEVFAKVFASADEVQSLVSDGMVDEQFSNRFMFWNETGELSNRTIFKSNKSKYTDVIRRYVYEYLKKGSDELISMGKEKAKYESEKTLQSIISLIKENQPKNSTIQESIKENMDIFKEEFRDIPDLIPYYFEHKNGIYITNKSKFVKQFVDRYYDSEKDYTKIKRISNNDILGVLELNPFTTTINGKSKKGTLWISKDNDNDNTKQFNFDFNLEGVKI